MMFAVSAILILHRWGVDEEHAAESVGAGWAQRRRMRPRRPQNLVRSNRALAVGLGSFAILVLFVALTSAILYDHELGPAGSPFKFRPIGQECPRQPMIDPFAADQGARCVGDQRGREERQNHAPAGRCLHQDDHGG